MLICPNKNSQEWKTLVNAVGETTAYQLFTVNNNELPDLDTINEFIAEYTRPGAREEYEKISAPSKEEVQYVFKSVNILLSDKAKQVFDKGNKNNWTLDKILTELAIPKDQKKLLLESGVKTREQLALELSSKYKYGVEINIGKQTIDRSFLIEQGYEDTFLDNSIDTSKVSSYYSNLSAPGGTGRNKYEDNPDWEYQELEIKTPLITPSIKGHAQFATEQGIGWARVWYNKKTGTVEIQEIQSDLFQKGRDKDNLISKKPDIIIDGEVQYSSQEEFDEAIKKWEEKEFPKNQFLQLLNKDSNWVTFFIKSIIQDSAKKGYEKILFPKGETAAKIEGHETIADEINNINNNINKIKARPIVDAIEQEYLNELEQRKAELKSQGIEKLKPIEAFYEIKVGNILEKQFGKENVKTITDEYGNEWREIDLTNKKVQEVTKVIEFQKQDSSKSNPNSQLNNILQELYPQIELEYTTDDIITPTGEKARGQYQAGKVLINKILENADTLPHEYAHHYIKMFKNAPVVQQGLRLFGDEEQLVSAIGKQTVAALNWYNRFFNWIKGLFSKKQATLNSLVKSFMTAEKLGDTNNVNGEVSYQTVEPSTIKSILTDAQQKVTFDEEAHVVTLKSNGKEFISTTTAMKLYGYGVQDDELSDKTALERGSKIGTTVHAAAEDVVNNTVRDLKDKTGFKISSDARADVKKIVADLTKDASQVMSEVIIYDETSGLSGIIDLLVVDKKGKVHIYDFKTKEKGFKYYTDTKFGHSDKTKYRLQLSIYKEILQNQFGITVDTSNIVMIKPTIEKDTVRRASLDASYNTTGVDTKLTEHSLAKDIIKDATNDNLPSVADDVRNMDLLNKQLNSAEKIVEDAITMFTVKLQNLEDIGKLTPNDRTRRISFIKQLKTQTTAKSLLLLIKNANTVITETHAELQEYKKQAKSKNSELRIAKLFKFREAVRSFDYIKDLASLIDKIPDLPQEVKDAINKRDSEGNRQIDRLRSKRDAVMDAYEKEEGLDVTAKFLAEYSTMEVGMARERYEREYGAKSAEFKAKTDKATYINDKLHENAEAIKQSTLLRMRSELMLASDDISFWKRFTGAASDSGDMATGAVMKAINIANIRTRNEVEEKQHELILILEELEKKFGSTLFKDPAKIYDFMLEKKNGVYTGGLVDRYTTELMDDYHSFIEEINSNEELTTDKKDKAIQEWKNNNAPLDREAFLEGLRKYLKEVHDSEELSENDWKYFKDNMNDKWFYIEAKLDQAVEDGNLSEDGLKLVQDWIFFNAWDYREPIEKYKNPQWKELSNILKDENDPRTKMYWFITKLHKEMDAVLPKSKRHKNQIPGVRKDLREGVKSSTTNTWDAIKTAVIEAGTLTPYDNDAFSRKPIQDEYGQIKYYLPTPYSSKLPLSEQSFDLGTVYMKTYAAAMDYKNKSEILPEVEAARYFIANRSAKLSDTQGDLIKKGAEHNKEKVGKTPKGKTKESDRLEDAIKAMFYGIKENDLGVFRLPFTNKYFSKSQALNRARNFTSNTLMSLNATLGLTNVTYGELQQQIEVLSKGLMSKMSYTKANLIYAKNLPKIAAQLGDRRKTNFVDLLLEKFNGMNESPLATLRHNSKLRNLTNTKSLSIFSTAGEHALRSRMLMGMLNEKKAIGKDGKPLLDKNGNTRSILDCYTENEHGRLELDKNVDLAKSKWTELDIELFTYKFSGDMDRIHGQFSEAAWVSMQSNAALNLLYQFRKFIPSGIAKRFDKKHWNERLGEFTQGQYNVFASKMPLIIKDFVTFKFALMSEDWNTLTDMEKANIRRTSIEMGALAMTIAAVALLQGGDDDDKPSGLAYYLLLRLRAELAFYVWLPSSLDLLRSPAATMSLLETVIRLMSQLTDPSEEFERGPFKGQNKALIRLLQMIPLWKQYYRMRDIDELSRFLE